MVGEVLKVKAHRRSEDPPVFYRGAAHALTELAE
ncbi:hypothetical protein FraQA3DRAFT_2051 [Frankia sp. QA3]|nr:hypothetical protein FraQA3DRAFT_2051 [Frankia sp. QA3]